MDCSSPNAMASLIKARDAYDISTGNDADADRHGIVTPDAGLMNPNHYLAVAIGYLYAHRGGWPASCAIGKTLVSSSMIDRVAAELGRQLIEVPVGFKWFVPGLIDGSVGFGGEESAGASFLRKDGTTWTTDKDGIMLALLASEILAVTGKSPSQHYAELAARHGDPAYARIDAPANREQKAKLAKLAADDVTRRVGRRRDDPDQADLGPRQRRGDRRAQGDHRVGLVRRPAVGHRGRLQDLRRVVPRPGPPGRGPARGQGRRQRRPRLTVASAASRECPTRVARTDVGVAPVAQGLLDRRRISDDHEGQLVGPDDRSVAPSSASAVVTARILARLVSTWSSGSPCASSSSTRAATASARSKPSGADSVAARTPVATSSSVSPPSPRLGGCRRCRRAPRRSHRCAPPSRPSRVRRHGRCRATSWRRT